MYKKVADKICHSTNKTFVITLTCICSKIAPAVQSKPPKKKAKTIHKWKLSSLMCLLNASPNLLNKIEWMNQNTPFLLNESLYQYKKKCPLYNFGSNPEKILRNSAVLWQIYETGCPFLNGNNEPTLCRNFCAYKCRA